MKNFPMEYLYVDNEGNTYYKRYKEKKEQCNVNPYTLASTAVVFSKEATVKTLFNLVRKNEYLKPYLFYFDEFDSELMNKQKEFDIKGCIRFNWLPFELSEKGFDINYPKMEVDGIDENNEVFGIDFLSCNEIADLKLVFDNNLSVLDENDNEVFKKYVHPTLFQVLYGFFWELSFYGNPESRDAAGKELLQSMDKENVSK